MKSGEEKKGVDAWKKRGKTKQQTSKKKKERIGGRKEKNTALQSVGEKGKRGGSCITNPHTRRTSNSNVV